MGRSIRVAAVQLAAHDRDDFARVLEPTLAAVVDASERADLVVLPEGTFPAYVLGNAPPDNGAVAGALARLREIARSTQTVIVAGAAVAVDGGMRNAAVVVDADGSLAGRADKLFLWHFDWRWFARGEHIAAIDTRAGRLGVLICADGRIPTIARGLVDDGAVALVMPTAWVTTGRDPRALENVQADLLARVRAYENRVPFVAANKCGSELGMVAYCGKSQIVDANGEIVAIASQDAPETLSAAVELADESPSRATIPNVRKRDATPEGPFRLAISFEPLPGDLDERIDLLADSYALAPGDADRLARLDRAIGVADVSDDVVLDPGGLVAYRRAGYSLIAWTTELDAPWVQQLARARALELRLYLVVFDRRSQRAFAVDPDGTIVAGTFNDYRLASFNFDPRRIRETFVAPGTDIVEGLEHIGRLVDRR